ncbi:MAG: hypothetical protein PHG47_03560 [Sulfuricella sp.]|nr:hypothetical protein [Sulfuricella sp.]
MANPLVVYLDSSGFSDLSDDRKIQKEPRLVNIRDELLYLQSTDQIQIRYSAFHILEAAHLTPESKPMAMSRAAAIQQLCGNKALIHYQDLFHKEIVALTADQKHFYRDKAYSNQSDWMPDFGNLFDGLQESFRTRLREELQKTGAIRSVRRAIEKKLFKADGSFTDEGAKILDTSDGALELKNQLPITERFYQHNMLSAYIKGEIDSATINNEIKNGICNPMHFIGWYAEQDGAKNLLSWLRGTGLDNINNIEELRLQVGRLSELAPVIGKSQDEVFDKVSNTLDGVISNVRKRLIRFFLNKATLPKRDVRNIEKHALNSQFLSLPGLDCFLTCVRQYAGENVVPSSAQRKLRRSDMGDMFHCIYIPYVDVFRADGYTSQIVSRNAAYYGTTVVPSLLDLPAAIACARQSRQ